MLRRADRLVVVVVLAVGALGRRAAVALGRGDELDGPGSARGRDRVAAARTVRRRRVRRGLQPADLGRRGARRRRAVGARAARPRGPPRRRPPHARARPRRPGHCSAPSRGCSGSRSTPTSRPTGASTCTGATAEGDTRVAEFRARRRDPSRARAAARRPARGEPQRRPARVRARRAPLPGPRRRRRRLRPRRARPGPATAARQAALRRRRRPKPQLARRADRPAQPVAVRVRPRARRGLDRRRRPGRRSRRSTASCSSPTSRRRTSAGTPSRATGAIEGGDALDRAGELVWPVAQYTHDDGCSVTGGVRLPAARAARLAAATSTATSARACCGARGARRRAAPTDVRRERAEVPAAHPHRPRRRRRAAVRLGGRRALPRDRRSG